MRAFQAGLLDGGEHNHMCAVLGGGSVRCWGAGSAWLGYGSNEPVDVPGAAGPIDPGPGRTAVSVTPGRTHVRAADDGAVRCRGGIGYGNTTTLGDDETPAAVGPVNLGPAGQPCDPGR